MQQKDQSLRKRTQIAKANRVMFLWVAGVSAVVGVSLVAIIFLVQMLLFNERVLKEKSNTIATLQSNNENISDLEDQIRLLDTNSVLASIKSNSDDQTIQVILDALPSDANFLAFGASLQYKLLAGIPDLEIVSLDVDPVVGIETLSDESLVIDASNTGTTDENCITFRFSVQGTEASLQKVLKNIEVSIRPIDIISLKIESKEDSRILTVEGRTYYEPSRIVELKDKTVK